MPISSRQRVVVSPREEIGTISPLLHGHFAEHLGELIYPGLSCGDDPSIPNIGGLRCDVMDALKPLGIPVLRWPGGCFADHYDWRDGIGPREARPLRVNHSWGMAPEPNTFGTHEFMAFCRAIGAEPYFAASVGCGTPGQVRDWVEYCNFGGGSTLADERRANGAEEPFGVRLWGIGNENWGCGGHMNPEEYAANYFRYRTFARDFSDTRVFGIACGPSGADWSWTRRFFEKAAKDYWNRLGMVQGFAAHYYCGTAGTATAYTDDQWLELLARAKAIDGVIDGTRQIMDEYDPDRKIRLIFDEWGTWHPVETGKPSWGLYQQNTMRDACVAALTLDTFHSRADQVYMANIAQLVNVLQALLLVEGSGCVKTPTYHVFDLYRPHKGATSVRLVSEAETVSDGGPSAKHCREQYLGRSAFALQAVHGSASTSAGSLCVTLVNTHPTEHIDAEVLLRDANWGEIERVGLEASDIHAHNTFADPDRVALGSAVRLAAQGAVATVPLAPGSIVRLRSTLC